MSVTGRLERSRGVGHEGCPSRESARRLHHVLAGVTFPAERWELIACAEHYGADGTTMHELHGLPAGRYRSIEHVAHLVRSPVGAERGRETSGGHR